jgi:signal transduction histidine kinase
VKKQIPSIALFSIHSFFIQITSIHSFLGLALSNRLARSMGGKLSCGSRTDGHSGAVFVLTLPV